MLPPNRNNAADRSVGEVWERRFCKLAALHGKAFTAQQIGRTGAASWLRLNHDWHRNLLPDVTVWTAPGEHHEIKHKNPTRYDSYGLEKYRLDALVAFARETQQSVLYTIHDWQLAGAHDRDEPTPNRIQDWRTADILKLDESIRRGLARTARMQTWVRGEWTEVPGYYWPALLWQPLERWWHDDYREVA